MFERDDSSNRQKMNGCFFKDTLKGFDDFKNKQQKCMK